MENFSKDVEELINEFTNLRRQAEANQHLLHSPYYPGETEEMAAVRRAKAEGATEAYSYCIQRLRMFQRNLRR